MRKVRQRSASGPHTSLPVCLLPLCSLALRRVRALHERNQQIREDFTTWPVALCMWYVISHAPPLPKQYPMCYRHPREPSLSVGRDPSRPGAHLHGTADAAASGKVQAATARTARSVARRAFPTCDSLPTLPCTYYRATARAQSAVHGSLRAFLSTVTPQSRSRCWSLCLRARRGADVYVHTYTCRASLEVPLGCAPNSVAEVRLHPAREEQTPLLQVHTSALSCRFSPALSRASSSRRRGACPCCPCRRRDSRRPRSPRPSSASSR